MSLELLVTMFSGWQAHPWICIAGDLDRGIVSVALLDSIGVKRRIKLNSATAASSGSVQMDRRK